MSFIVGLFMELFGIVVGFKLISLGLHWMRTGFATLREKGDEFISTVGMKSEKKGKHEAAQG